MNAFSLINPALGIYVISAVLAWVVCAHKPLSGAIAGIGGWWWPQYYTRGARYGLLRSAPVWLR